VSRAKQRLALAAQPVQGPQEGATPWIGPGGLVMRRLELHVTWHCPEACRFCSEDHRMKAFNPFPATWGRLAKVVRKHAERGVEAVHFTGGEPTIHPRFIDLLALCRELGLRTSVGTIGTMLARPDFAERTVPLLDEALFSLHGPTAALHDELAGRDGSFETVTRAIGLAREIDPAFRAAVNTVVTRHNLEQLPDTAALAASLGVGLIIVSNTTPEGAAIDRYDELAVPLDDLARVLPTVPGRAGDAIVRFFGVPMCLLGEHRMLSNDLHWDPRVTAEWARHPGRVVFDDFYNWRPDRKRTHVAACADCNMSSLCTGVYSEFAQRFPVTRLGPV
jgi:MoaA/NifB/PqqE/SkfB family radical SAM enzyme